MAGPGVKLFGFNISRDEPEYLKKEPIANDSISIVDRDSESTAAIVASTSSATGIFLDVQGTIKLESELVTKYRDMVSQHEVDNAVDEIVNEAMTIEDDFLVKIDLTLIPDQVLDENAKAVLEDKHNEILELMDFKAKSYSIFKRWYVDGRIYYHVVVDPKKLEEGIKELRYVDPRKLREIKEVESRRIQGYNNMNQAADVQVTKAEYYLYNEKGFSAVAKGLLSLNGAASSGIRVTKDSIVHIPSGITDTNGTMGIGFLHKAMRVLTQLKTIEDSVIIYRLARAPERRVWYVDVGNLPTPKAEQQVQRAMTMQKNKLIYDSDTGKIQDSRKFMTMLEDYWLPRRPDGSGTKVELLKGGETLLQMDDVLYFQKLLYNSLNVPVERLQTDNPFQAGSPDEINKSEIKFDKFINRITQQFSLVFREILKKQLVLQGLMTIEEFASIEKLIKYKFARDNHWAELKDAMIRDRRIQNYMGLMETGLIGKYFSHKSVRHNIFQQTDDDISKMTEEIIEEMQNPLYNQPQPGQEGDPQASQVDQAQEQNAEAEGQAQQAQLAQQTDQGPEQPPEGNPDDINVKLQIMKQGVDAIKAIPNDKRSGGDSKRLRNFSTKIAKLG